MVIQSAAPAVPISTRALWTGRVLSGLVVLFLLFDGIGKVLRPAPIVAAFVKSGFPVGTAFGIGLVLILCTLLYAVPRTAIVGALLLTAYLGGATATMVRVGMPPYFPIAFGVIVWLSLYLRQSELRAFVKKMIL